MQKLNCSIIGATERRLRLLLSKRRQHFFYSMRIIPLTDIFIMDIEFVKHTSGYAICSLTPYTIVLATVYERGYIDLFVTAGLCV